MHSGMKCVQIEFFCAEKSHPLTFIDACKRLETKHWISGGYWVFSSSYSDVCEKSVSTSLTPIFISTACRVLIIVAKNVEPMLMTI